MHQPPCATSRSHTMSRKLPAFAHATRVRPRHMTSSSPSVGGSGRMPRPRLSPVRSSNCHVSAGSANGFPAAGLEHGVLGIPGTTGPDWPAAGGEEQIASSTAETRSPKSAPARVERRIDHDENEPVPRRLVQRGAACTREDSAQDLDEERERKPLVPSHREDRPAAIAAQRGRWSDSPRRPGSIPGAAHDPRGGRPAPCPRRRWTSRSRQLPAAARPRELRTPSGSCRAGTRVLRRGRHCRPGRRSCTRRARPVPRRLPARPIRPACRRG